MSASLIGSAEQLKKMADAIRVLSMDAVEAAQSGHQGMPMGMADAATVLFARHLEFNPADPSWPDRDRFVLSAGHGSMLLYALFHLTGYPGMTMAEIRNFRQLGAKTPGHPEFGHTAGVETTTGPLGQGIATAVGMAIAERHLNAVFGDALVDHRTYVLASDGDLMEGVSHEAAALAGHLRLARLIVLFDDNGISIDGPTSLTESTDVLARFTAYGWRTERIDGHDPAAVDAALTRAKTSDRPSLIACRTRIGFGSPSKAGTAAIHGFALKGADVAAVRTELGWTEAPFVVPSDLREAWLSLGRKGAPARAAWLARLQASPERAEFERRMAAVAPASLGAALLAHKAHLVAKPEAIATRKASELALEVITQHLPEAIGGSADLTGSNNTKTKATAPLTASAYSGRFLHYGVREHGMAAAMNGLALHGGVLPYYGTILVFSDYARPAIRLSALMGLRVVHVMTHDSIGLGEDGPTHQPVEHLAALRAMPNLLVLRPADAVETAECWQMAIERKDGPSLIALSRQNLAPVRRTHTDENLCAAGAYVLEAARGRERACLVATGSEVEIALAAQDRLEAEGIGARVVSMPCRELFLALPAAERARLVPPGLVKVAVEAGVAMGWERVIGEAGAFIGMAGFGASAPYQKLYKHFGITAEAVAAAVTSRL